MTSTCILFADLASYIFLMSQLIMSSQVAEDTAAISDDIDGFNSAISPSRHGQQRQQPDENKTYALGPTARRSLRKRTTSELQDVICFFCLDKGCQHARGESYLAMGGLDLGNIICTPCGNSCSICTRILHEMFLPVYQSSVVLFLEFLMQSGQLQQEIDPKLPVSAIKRFGRRHCSIGRQVAFTECTWTHCSYH